MPRAGLKCGGVPMNVASYWEVVKTAAGEWVRDKVPQMGAALAFYSVLSMAPLLVIAIAVAAMVFGEEAATGQLVGQIRGLVGKEGAEAVQDDDRQRPEAGAGDLRHDPRRRDPPLRRVGGLRPAPGRDEHDLGGRAEAGARHLGARQGPLPLADDGLRDRLPAARLAHPEHGAAAPGQVLRRPGCRSPRRCSRGSTCSSRSRWSRSSSR